MDSLQEALRVSSGRLDIRKSSASTATRGLAGLGWGEEERGRKQGAEVSPPLGGRGFHELYLTQSPAAQPPGNSSFPEGSHPPHLFIRSFLQ